MERRKRRLFAQIAFLLFLIVGSFVIVKSHRDAPYQHNTGTIFGTVYHATYQSRHDLRTEIERVLHKVDLSLSTFNKQSVISRINNGEQIVPDKMFIEVFNMAQQVSEKTSGAFDITVAPLVNAWGFGFKDGIMPTQTQVDSLLTMVGYEKIALRKQNGKSYVYKADDRIMLDCSAIAKGYAVDVVAAMLASRGVENYMVEIGGEIVTHGKNPKQQSWKIGVTVPEDDSLNVNTDLQTVLNVHNEAMATSGNYRNFYYKDGRKYAHTIDPKTGFPTQHSLLSATVLAPQCAVADAYATAFMVMGLEKAKQVLAENKDLAAYFIYTDEQNKTKVWYSDNIKSRMADE